MHGLVVEFSLGMHSGFDTWSSYMKNLAHAISLLNIQNFGKEHGSETRSATR